MAKKQIFLWSLLFICFYANAQTTFKVYLNADGEKIIDSAKAAYYLLMTEIPKDSVWSVQQYDIKGTILTSGYYKDAQLSIPHGKFEYYKVFAGFTNTQYNYGKHKMDTLIMPRVNYVQYTGYYVNGKKSGKWEEYSTKGKLLNISTYKDDVLDGLYQIYDVNSGMLLSEGNMINNVREGEWSTLSYKGEKITSSFYKNGKVIKNVSYLSDKKFQNNVIDAKTDYDLLKYLNNALSTRRFSKPGKFSTIYDFTLTTDGRLIKPSVINGSSLEVDTAVVNSFLAAPVWVPAMENNKAITTFIAIQLDIEIDDDKRILVTFHPSLNGRNDQKMMRQFERVYNLDN